MSHMARNNITTTKSKANTVATLPSLRFIFGAVVVLIMVVLGITTLSIEQSKTTMVRLLVGEGSALIQAVEGSVRMSMGRRDAVQLQSNLQELASADVRFIAITMPDGTILAHSSPERLGEVLEINGQEASARLLNDLSQQTNDMPVRWFIANMDGESTFVVYREFMPRSKRVTQPRPPRLGMGRGGPRTFNNVPNQPLIFLGLDIGPFEESKAQDRVHFFTLAGGGSLVGMALLLSLFYAQRARESRRRQDYAEGQVRELEEEMRRKEKMAAIGNLAAGVAHEIRNPLSSIKGYATYFGQRFPEDSEDRKAAHVMVREVERLNRVITDLIGLSRPTDVRPKPTDITLIVEHTIQLLRQDAQKNNISLQLHTPKKSLPLVLLDIDRINQALLNVCLNAMEAMPTGGELALTLYIKNKHFVCLEISDNGQGIEEKNLTHIFDPYFTTKGQGTGLGLATVHKIIEAHHGEISVVSKHHSQHQNSGTTFSMLFPVA